MSCLSPYVTAIDQTVDHLYSKRVYCLVKEFTSVLHDNVVKILVCFCAAQVKSVCVLRSGAKRH